MSGYDISDYEMSSCKLPIHEKVKMPGQTINYIDLGLLIIILIILIGMVIGIYWVYQRVLYYLGIWDDYVDEWHTMQDEFHAEYGYIGEQFGALNAKIDSIEATLAARPQRR